MSRNSCLLFVVLLSFFELSASTNKSGDSSEECGAPPTPSSCPGHPKIQELGLCFQTNEPYPYLLLLFIVIFTSVLGLIIHAVDKMTVNHRSFVPILNKVYRELMLLGIISFLLFIAETSDWCDLQKVLDVEAFEWTHYLIFFISISYVSTVLFLLALVSKTYRDWKKMQKVPPHETRQAFIEAEKAFSDIVWWKRIFCIPTYLRYRSAKRAFFFLHTRSSFIIKYSKVIYKEAIIAHKKAKVTQIPSKNEIIKNFDFVRYVRKAARHILVDLLELPSSLTISLIVLIVIQIIRLSISGGSVELGTLSYIISCGYVLLIPSFLFLYVALLFNLTKYQTFVAEKAQVGETEDFLQSLAEACKEHRDSSVSFLLDSSHISHTPNTNPTHDSQKNFFEKITARLSYSPVLVDLTQSSEKVWKMLGPKFFFRILQFLTYWQCIYVSVVVLYITIHIQKDPDANAFYYFFAWFPPVFVYIFALPRVVPMYTVLVCIGEGDHHKNIKECFKGKVFRELKKLAPKQNSFLNTLDDLDDDDDSDHSH